MRVLIVSFIVATLLVLSCKSKDKKPTSEEMSVTDIVDRGDSLLLTDSSWGWIRAHDNIDDLKKLYGNNVKDERICGPECIDSIDVTIIYPGSGNEFYVYWKDSAYHKEIATIDCHSGEAGYHTASGIKIGTSLKELLQINGKPISFYGFGWDYGGSVTSLNKGTLENSRVRFNLDLFPDYVEGENAVSGDTELRSDMPAVKKLEKDIRVSELMLHFNK